MKTILSKITKAHREGKLLPALKSRAMPYLYGLKYIIRNPAADKIDLHCPGYIAPSKDSAEMELVERIFKSFKKNEGSSKKGAYPLSSVIVMAKTNRHQLFLSTRWYPIK